MKFGIFDHLDDNGVPLQHEIENRLQLIEMYDKAGFHAYHLAEHHGTPLGYGSSPSVFMAAVAQRTKRIRLGVMVYVLPLYHPIRLIEEICFLDHMSGGRLEMGVGKGVNPVEVGFYDVDPAIAADKFYESLEIIKKGLASDTLSHAGKFYHFDKVPMVMKPVQKPHPPIWYGVLHTTTCVWAAKNDANILSLIGAPAVREITDAYRSEWQKLGKPAAKLPILGLMRMIVVADTDAEARRVATRAYEPWAKNMVRLWGPKWKHGVPFPIDLPMSWDPWQDHGTAIAGSPATVRAYLEEQVATSGVNYVACDMSFGAMRHEEAKRSVELFTREVMPALTEKAASAAQ